MTAIFLKLCTYICIYFLLSFAGVSAQDAPQLESSPFSIAINQNVLMNSLVLTISCTYSGTVEYEIVAFTPNVVFLSIDSTSGEIRITRDATDLSLGNYMVSLRCFDPLDPILDDLSILTVTRADENEFLPQFLHSDPFVVLISESRDFNVDPVVADIDATDSDQGTFGNIEYGVEGSIPSSFSIDSSSGVIFLQASLDYESVPLYQFIVTASNPLDPATGLVRSAEVLVIINITNVNDAPPIFTELHYQPVVSETFLPDYPRPSPGFFSVQCTDLDTDQADITYAISLDSDPGPFVLNTMTGSFSVTADLDYESLISYSFSVMCFDNGSPNLTASALVTINLSPVNEFDPRITNNAGGFFLLPESLPVGTVIISADPMVDVLEGRYTVTDSDAGPDGNITYTLSGASNTEYFGLGFTTGSLVLIRELDLDTVFIFLLTAQITACDTFPPRDVCPNLLIRMTVAEEDDNLPTFSQDSYNVSVTESTESGTSLLQATCTDGDTGSIGLFSGIQFFAPTQEVMDTFILDDITGEVTTAVGLDYEGTQSYSFQLLCTDTAGNEDFSLVQIEVVPENDNPPQFQSNLYMFDVSRTTPATRYPIGVVSAFDEDIGTGGDIQYTLEENGFFDITSIGVIELFNSVLDHPETSLNLSVQVSDGLFTDTATILITLTAGNFFHPQFAIRSRAVEVSELSPVGTSISSVFCNDTDGGVNGEIRYFITGGDTNETFQIDPIIGTISVASSLILPDGVSDIEYLLDIQCEDGGIPVFSDVVVIFIRVFRDDSNPPQIGTDPIVTFISEDAAINELVLVIGVIDSDASRLSYRLENENVQGTFVIDPSSGAVFLAAALDRERVSSYEMTVVVTEVRDSPGPERSDSALLIINVMDVNDNSPSCDVTVPVVLTISESLEPGSLLLPLNCSDPDANENGTITYSLSDDFGVLSVNNVGNLVLMNYFNATDLSTLATAVIVSDQGSPSRHTMYQVTIFVTLMNLNVPTFVNLPATVELSEGTPIHDIVFTALAFDPDRGSFGQISYQITSGNSGGNFAIFPNTGAIFIAEKLNFFQQQMYNLTISASDSDSTVTELLTVQVQDANEYTPDCSSILIVTSIAENLSPNQSLSQQLSCSDADEGTNGDIIFTIQSGNEGNVFEILADGSIVVTQTLDFEITQEYELLVAVSDSGNPPLSVNVTVVVIVQPVNEHSPLFSETLYTAVISEDANLGMSVVQVSATDDDLSSHPHGQVVYTILDLEQPPFSISRTGLIQVVGNLDREQRDFYSFAVQASDQGLPPKIGLTTVEINITDVDDNVPRFSQEFYIATLNETTETETPVLTVTCSDPDVGINGTVVFSFDNSSDSQFFEIQPSGQIAVREDLPISQTYSFIVFCTELGPANFFDTAIISVLVLTNSNITFNPSNRYNASLPEDTIPIFNILQVDATISTDVVLTYMLLTESTPFSLNETTGSLQLIAPLDYESTRSYNLRIQVSDNGSPPNIGEALIEIEVENINDHQPQIITNPLVISLTEGPIDAISTIGVYICIDGDSDEFGQVAFKIVSGNEGGLFAVSENGTLQLIGDPDYETSQAYTLQLSCADGGFPARVDTVFVPISVLPINDNSPEFMSDSIDISVTEALPLNFNVGPAIQATDADLPPHNDLRYSIISGNNDSQFFTISSTSGQLTLVNSLDFESTPSITLVIEAQDSGGQVNPDFQVLNDTISVTITILDINDNIPQFSQQIYFGTIEESVEPNGQVILDDPIVCTDDDSGENGRTTINITSGNTDDIFAVEDFGILITQRELGSDTSQIYQLVLECQDDGNPQLSSQAIVIISVIEVNEFGPQFNQSQYVFQVPENTLLGTEIGRIVATDQDSGEQETVSYEFINSTSSAFTVDYGTGDIILLSSLDYETQVRMYIFEAIATDSSGLNDTVAVVIEVQNVDDNLPGFTQTSYFASVLENADSGEFVIQVSCSDADDQADSVPSSYSLIDTSAPFQITDGRISTVEDLDFEVTPLYTLAIACSDSAGNVATASVFVDVIPFNDFPPVFAGEVPYTLELLENPSIGLPVFQVTASDNDTGIFGDIVYSFISGNDLGIFEINPATGVVTVIHSIDREEESLYTLEILAQNMVPSDDTSGSLPLSVTTTLNVTVLDINDNDPTVTPNELTLFVSESNSSSIPFEIATFTCSDPDFGANGSTNFSITSENTANNFQIFENGTLIATAPIIASVVVEVTCADNGTPQRSSSTIVILHPVTANDHTPTFPQSSYTLEVPEAQEIGEVIQCFTAIDMDGPEVPEGTLAYSLEPDNLGIDISRFSIGEESGCVFVSIALSPGAQNYQYTVVATDMGTPPLSGNTTLIIVVVDVIQDSPVFATTPYLRIIPEDAEIGTFIADTTCTDQDVDDIISYSIAGGDNDGIFSIDNETGIVVLAQRLDFEASMSYSLLVECTDSFNLSDSTNVFITVTPVNEFTPAFQAVAVSVPEHSIGGTLVTQLEWTDADAGSDGEVTFNIISGNINTAFVITNDGRILVAGVLDREILNFYQIDVQISDLAEVLDERRLSVNDINITITDINDNSPMFELDMYIFGPLEGNEMPDHYVGTVECSDMDIGSNAEITYQLAPDNGVPIFGIDQGSGNLTVSGDLLTRESDDIVFLIECIDRGTRQLTGTAIVAVSVVEVNRFEPAFVNSSYQVTLPEDTPTNVPFLTVIAEDQDVGAGGQVRYFLEDFGDTFSINEDTGDLSLLKMLNFEMRTEYVFAIQAIDGTLDSSIRMSANVNITINVTAVNEYDPVCLQQQYSIVINHTHQGDILDLGCSDDDAGMDGVLVYSITSGNEIMRFDISENGQIVVPNPILPDFNTEQYTLEVTISDSGNPSRQNQVTVVVVYSFENRAQPMLSASEYSFAESELVSVGQIITTLQATDTDPSLQGEITFSVTGTESFRANPSSGELFISSPLDFETNSFVQFTVVAKDNDPFFPRSDSALVNVTVQNENDTIPVCDQVFYTAEISSDAQIGDTVLMLGCTDPDSSGSDLTYRLADSRRRQMSSFAVDDMGRVLVASAPASSTTTAFTILITDSGGETSEVIVSVPVTFINSEPPVFTQSEYTFDVQEGTPLLSSIGSISATDADSNPSDLSYSVDNSEQVEFFIDPTTGNVILTAPLDFETVQNYTFRARVEDGGGSNGSNSFSDTASIVINVLNTNDNLPRLRSGGTYSAIVSRGTVDGSDVLTIECTDGDAPPYGEPEISNVNFVSLPFDLVGSGGVYIVRVSGNISEPMAYAVNIACTDAGGRSTDGQVLLFVPELEAPVFDQPMYEWILSETAPFGSQFTDIVATSSNESGVFYSFIDGNDAGLFYINPSTGVVSLVGNLDYETDRTHSLIIRATDGESRQSSVLLLVQVLDQNDEIPVIPPTTVLQVRQNSPIGYPVGTVDCLDEDSNSNTSMLGFAFTPASDTFSIGQYGIVRVEGMLGATSVYTLSVTCYDATLPDATSTGAVIIAVMIFNQYHPVFDFEMYVFSIREDADVRSLVGTVQAADRDVGNFGEIFYTISESGDSFYIEALTGRIKLLTSLDRETAESYEFTVVATDGGSSAPDNSRLIGTAVVSVLVEDVNDDRPVPGQSSYVQSINTNHTIFTSVLSVQCTDADVLPQNGDISYSLSPSTEHFVIQADGTVLLVRQQLDAATHSFDIVCTDNGNPMLSSLIPVTIVVNSPELNVPVFTMDQYAVNISANEPVFSTFFQVNAIPANNSIGTVYSIVGGDSGSQFHVNPTTGDLVLVSSLDMSEEQFYALIIQATDARYTFLYSFAVVEVMVVPVNTIPPVFSSPFYAGRVIEGAQNSTPVVQLECTDGDVNSEISYRINSEPTAPVFSITQDGLIVVCGAIDYETEIVHTLQVICRDGGSTPLTTEATVRIEVLPLNEFTPVFSQLVYQFSAPENGFGMLIGRVEAVDQDRGSQGEITYRLQDPNNIVVLQPSTGDVLVANNLDYEAQRVWNLTVIARDGAGAESHAFLEITVTNVNDVNPELFPATSIATIPFDSPPGFPIEAYACTDADETGTTISILNGNSLGYFELNVFNQLVWTGTASLITSDTVLSLTLQCQDDEAPAQTVDSQIVITVRAGERTTPQFSQEIYNASVLENSPAGTFILSVLATSIGSEILYDLHNVPTDFPFSVNETTGTVYVNSEGINHEMTPLYVFAVQATDTGLGTDSFALLRITIEDTNDNRPVILPALQSIILPEDFPFTSVATFACFDSDEGSNGEIMFQLTTGSEETSFNVSSTGTVELANSLDFETTQNYSITVVCSDAGDPTLSASASLLITVTGVNEYAPQFDRAAYNFTVDENAEAGELVGMVSASDRDAGVEGEVRFEIVAGNVANLFVINLGGEILTTTQPLNATQLPSLQLTVRTIDVGSLSNDTTVTISVSDINEPPLFSGGGNYLVRLPTTPMDGVSVLDFVCFDTDLDDNAVLELEIISNPFDLDVFLLTEGGMGTLEASVIVNATLPVGSFNLVIRCSDIGIPPLDTNTSIILRVEGVNLPPQFDPNTPLTIAIREDTMTGTLLTTVSANDTDSDVIYEITGGSGLGTFDIDSFSGEIFLALPLDYEIMPDYIITIAANDQFPTMPLSTSIDLSVAVINTNDIQPILSPPGFQIITISENTLPVYDATVYSCADPEGSIVTFSIDPPNGPLSPFDIAQNSSTGTIQLLSPIDFEEQTMYTLTVTCTDTAIQSADSPLQTTSILTIYVTPENNYSPEFVSLPSFTVAEDATAGDVIARVEATDRDNRGQITYSSSSHTGLFLVDLLSGNITLIGELDYEDLQMYTLTIEASDNDNAQGVEPRATSASVEIRVTDANDNRPVCTSSIFGANLNTGNYTFISLLRLTCSDEDEGLNSLLNYSIDSIVPSVLMGGFVLNNTTGELGFTGTITLADTIVIQILVSDSGDEPLATRVIVTVQVESSEVAQPRFEPNQFSINISENTPAQSTVVSGSVLQQALYNPRDDTVEYTLQANPINANTFLIDFVTGDIILSSPDSLDYDEGLQTYSLTVEASVGGTTATAAVNITLTDYNDNAPLFTEAAYEGVVTEGLPNGAAILQVEAEDIDSGLNGDFRYELSGTTEFSINLTSGQIIALETLDRESTSIFSFLVLAADFGIPQQIGSALVTIRVEDVNDTPPQFAESFHSLSINDLSPEGAQLLTFRVIDPDLTNIFTFRIITDDPAVEELFSVESPSGILRQISEITPANSASRYNFTIEVSDGAGSDNTAVVVYVFSITSTTVLFEENVREEMFNVQDFLVQRGFNISGNATYEITEGNDQNELVITTEGILRPENALDRESTSQYSLSISVEDGTTLEQVNVSILVVVADQNDNAPLFSDDTYEYEVIEGTYTTLTAIGSIVAMDSDELNTANSHIEYSSVNSPNSLSIDRLSGEVFVLGVVDFETNTEYDFTVRASDVGSPPQVSYASIVVRVTDVNDNDPQFVPVDVVEYIVSITAGTQSGVQLDDIIAILPQGSQQSISAFVYTDPDATSEITSSLKLINGINKFQLQSADPANSDTQTLVTTSIITEEDNATILQIILRDEPESQESNPIARNISILVLQQATASPTSTSDVTTESPTSQAGQGGLSSTATVLLVILIIVLILMAVFGITVCCCWYSKKRRERYKVSQR